MKHSLNSLTTINIELTNRCNKDCWICGRRKVEKNNPTLYAEYNKNIDFSLLKIIANQLPPNIVVQFHNNGESLLYPQFGEALRLFKTQIKNVVTNGILLVEKADEIIENLDSITISIIENDEEADIQLKTIEKFIEIKGNKAPFVILRFNGDIDEEKYKHLNLLKTRRILHNPLGSFNYQKKDPTIPEIGICLDFLNHPAINTQGDVSICVRFDPEKKGILGNIKENSLEEIWNNAKRIKWLEYHKRGKRELVPLCEKCDFWGVPTGK